MAYVNELDDLPWEARFGVATTLRFFFKENVRNVSVSGTPTVNFYSSSGADLGADTTGVVVSPAQDTDQQYRAVVVPSTFALGERYRARITWTSATSSVAYAEDRLFDVVRTPFGAPWTSLNDLIEARPEVLEILDRWGQRLGYAAGDVARENAAGIAAVHGRLWLEAKIRDQISRDAVTTATETKAGRSRTGLIPWRPALIIDRQRLMRPERFAALAHVYRGVAKAPDDGDDTHSQLYRHFRDQAEAAWLGVGPLAYDHGDAGSTADLADDVRSHVWRRRQS